MPQNWIKIMIFLNNIDERKHRIIIYVMKKRKKSEVQGTHTLVLHTWWLIRISHFAFSLSLSFFCAFYRAEGSNILLDTDEVCRKARRGKRGKLYEICKDETHLFHEIKRGIELGFNECESQFRNHKWNCTRLRKSMKKILMIGKFCRV